MTASFFRKGRRFPGTALESGGVAALLAFLIWGCLPLYWKTLDRMPPLEILCHRVFWSFWTMLPVILCTGRLGHIMVILGSRARLLPLAASSLVLSGNWLLFIWAVNSGRVLETSLGYFINPLLNILLGMILFRERLRPAAWVAVALAAAGVGSQIISLGHLPWTALSLGGSFALYGLIRKMAPVEALPGLFMETLLILPAALAWLLWEGSKGTGVTFAADPSFLLLLAASGPLTALPLFLFAFGVRRLRMTSLGLLQYVSPTMTFFQGVFLFGEPFSLSSLLTFSCIWAALALYSWDSLGKGRTAAQRT
ncbi:MAG: EamA family transporter RarD [Desulfovibrio sp.]|nr:EamA family transporter RarD [Desulfovibrio sp.]